MIRCLNCCRELPHKELSLHPACRKRIFGGSKVKPHISKARHQIIKEIREKALRMSLGGAQPKASVSIRKAHLEIVSHGGEYLLKPSTEKHPSISENEHFCMNVVRAFKLPTPEFSLITLEDGELAYLVKRFDRNRKEMYHVEDFASVLNYPCEKKYDSGYVQVAAGIDKYCRDKGLERQRLFRLILLSYVLGNSDLHLKNFSLLDKGNHHELSPVYDVVCSTLYYPESSDLALELDDEYEGGLVDLGYYSIKDFSYLGSKFNLAEIQLRTIFEELYSFKKKVFELLEYSFLPAEQKKNIRRIIEEQYKKLYSQ